MFRLLASLCLLTAPALAQQVNPLIDIAWLRGAGCGTIGYSYSPANQACIPSAAAGFAWESNVGTAQGVSDTTLTLGALPAGLPTAGTFFVDSEWESYTGINVGALQLTGITRAVAQTTAATHSSGTNVISVNVTFSPFTQTQRGGVFGAGGGGSQAMLLAINCGAPAAQVDQGTNFLAVLQANCSGATGTWIDSGGNIHQNALGAGKNFLSPIYVSPLYNSSYATGAGAGLPIPISNTSDVAQVSNQQQFRQPIGVTSVSGGLRVTPVATIGAPTVTGILGGSCNVTYDVVGQDIDGNAVAGTPTAVTGALAPGLLYLQVPETAGVATYIVYRTAVSGGCGSATIGKGFASNLTTAYPFFSDNLSVAGDGTTPPAAASVAKTCIGVAGNSTLFCSLAGTSSTPPVTCSAFTAGWEYHNTTATTSPNRMQICQGSWTGVY